MKRKRRLAVIWLAWLMAVCMAAPALAGGFNAKTRDGVVVIYTLMEETGSHGTGFFVGREKENPQYLLTNYHVVEDYLNHGGGTNKSSAQLLVVYDLNQMEEAYVIDVLEEKDLALLRINRPTEQRTALRLSVPKEAYVGNPVYAVGYPGVADNVHDSLSYYGSEDATVTSGSMSRLLTESGTGRMLIQMDAEINGGNSGGPLVNEKGNVIGVNVENVMTTVVGVSGDGLEVSQVKTPGVNFAINIEEALPLLDRNNIKYTVAGDFDLRLLLFGAGVVLAAAILAAVLVVLRKRKGAPKRTAKHSGGHFKGKSSASEKKPVIRSLSAQHNGIRVPVGEGQLLIGRDPASCGILYQEGTPGVSSRHCSVQWDGASEEFLIMDLRSTYGTYLLNGQRLTPGVPCRLRSGDGFYLGDRGNELRAELE